MEILFGIVLLIGVTAFVLAPLRRPLAVAQGEPAVIAELEARKEAKYREIRDAELDHAVGKLSDADFTRQDAELRREALAILDELERAEANR